MIPRQKFDECMKDISNLTGQPIKKEMVNSIYMRVMERDMNDFVRAVDAILESEPKFNFFVLLKYLNTSQIQREEKEYQALRLKREEKAKEFWKNNYGPDQSCSRKCKECPARFCNTVASASLKAMERMLSGITDKHQAHAELAKQFPEMGFEKYHGAPEPF